jgi:hypothetical protein
MEAESGSAWAERKKLLQVIVQKYKERIGAYFRRLST